MLRSLRCAGTALCFGALTLGVSGCLTPSSTPALNVNAGPPTMKRSPRVSPLYNFYYSFNKSGLEAPTGPLYLGSDAKFYGTTWGDGACPFTYEPYGGVYEINNPTTNPPSVSTLYDFCDFGDGALLLGVVRGPDGTLYGTASEGGYAGGSDCITEGCGFVYKLVDNGGTWKAHILMAFNSNPSYSQYGCFPGGAPVLHDNVLYGVTSVCGAHNRGVAYRINTDGSNYQVIYNFTGPHRTPEGPLARDTSGDLYGTVLGASPRYVSCSPPDCGSVYELKPNASGTSYTFVDLYDFQGASLGDGASPTEGVTLLDNFIYGTTSGGGIAGASCERLYSPGCGVVFKLVPSASGYTEAVLHKWSNQVVPSGLVASGSSLLYGTTAFGGTDGNGIVFSITTTGTYTKLHDFAGYPSDGGNSDYFGDEVPAIDASGNIWGATAEGGSSNEGTVYEITSGSGGLRSRRHQVRHS